MVLILIILEYTLRDKKDGKKSSLKGVLILIILEYTLRVFKKSDKKFER